MRICGHQPFCLDVVNKMLGTFPSLSSFPRLGTDPFLLSATNLRKRLVLRTTDFRVGKSEKTRAYSFRSKYS